MNACRQRPAHRARPWQPAFRRFFQMDCQSGVHLRPRSVPHSVKTRRGRGQREVRNCSARALVGTGRARKVVPSASSGHCTQQSDPRYRHHQSFIPDRTFSASLRPYSLSQQIRAHDALFPCTAQSSNDTRPQTFTCQPHGRAAVSTSEKTNGTSATFPARRLTTPAHTLDPAFGCQLRWLKTQMAPNSLP